MLEDDVESRTNYRNSSYCNDWSEYWFLLILHSNTRIHALVHLEHG